MPLDPGASVLYHLSTACVIMGKGGEKEGAATGVSGDSWEATTLAPADEFIGKLGKFPTPFLAPTADCLSNAQLFLMCSLNSLSQFCFFFLLSKYLFLLSRYFIIS